jgi:hypothetical protein
MLQNSLQQKKKRFGEGKEGKKVPGKLYAILKFSLPSDTIKMLLHCYLLT